jgi:predicted acylesterase/phospholipase RssA
MTFKILALGGGGMKGILHIGAIKILEKKFKFEEFYGCSVGAIVAVGLAHNLDYLALERISTKISSFNKFTTFSLIELQTSFQKKGLFEMDLFEKFILELFDSEEINLREKKICDAPKKLKICSTNITKHNLTVFSGNVPILKALRASCCIPLIFCPQIINNSVYIDGGYLTNVIMDFIPFDKRKDTLSLSIIHDDPKITPQTIKNISHLEFLYGMYKSSCIYERKKTPHKNNINLNYSLPSGISDIGEKQRQEMISKGSELTLRFLSQSSFQESIKD